ncbi:MAG: flagellar basal body-associated FliL family protein [Desulfonatronovibrio sp.]
MAENNSSEEKDVTLDKSELNIDRAREKVELDLDDAPFLDEEEVPEEKEEEPHKIAAEKEKPVPSLEREKKYLPAIWKNRKIQASIGVLLILALLASVFLFFLKDRPHPPEAPEEADVPPEVVEEPEPVYEELIDFKPFMIELRDGENIQFLYSKFSFPAQSEEMAREINDKSIILRDSIYYYLRSQEAIFLRNKDNSDKIKNDILSVVNQYLSTGRVQDLLIEEYLVK